MATIAPPLFSPAAEPLWSRAFRALGPEGTGLALFVGAAICFAIAALAFCIVASPMDLDQAALMAP